MRTLSFVVLFFVFPLSLFAETQISSEPSKKYTDTDLNPKEIKILVWNIKKAEAGDKWQRDYDKLISQYDLIAVQETLLKPGRKSLTNKNQIIHQDTAVSFYKKDSSATGVTTTSDIKPTTIKAVSSPDREPFLNTPKMSMLTTYKIEGSKEQLLMVNTHAINFVSDAKFKNQMLDIAKYIKNHKGPVSWVGDFNTWSNSRLKILNAVVESLGMLPITFEKDERSTFMFGHKVDHIFTRGLSASKAEVFNNITTSDHHPLSVTLYVDPLFSKKIQNAKLNKPKEESYLKEKVEDILKFIKDLDEVLGLTPSTCYQ